MQIEIKLDASYKEPKIIVLTDKMTEEINTVLSNLSEGTPQMLAGFRENNVELLEQADIIRVYSAAGKVLAVTQHGEYRIRQRLYELEERLNKNYFVRISNSEIVNLKQVKGFDLSLTGTICVRLPNGAVTYVSRRYVAKIKQMLGM